jgi:uncharacterized protein YacL
MPQSTVIIARLLYVLISSFSGFAIARYTEGSGYEISPLIGALVGFALSAVLIGFEISMKRMSLRGFAHAIFGFGIGIMCAWALNRIGLMNLVFVVFADVFQNGQDGEIIRTAVFQSYRIGLYLSLGFLGTVLSLRSNRDDFAFVIPYFRFRQEGGGTQPIVLDREMLMEGRLIRILNSGFITGRVIIANFVLEAIEAIAKNEADPQRQRAQRSLKNLHTVKAIPFLEVSFHDSKTGNETRSTQDRLIELSQIYNARLLTANQSLATYAKLQGVTVLNVNDLQEALQQTVAIGERLHISLSRPGKEEHQGVGYLADGSMVVVNHGATSIGSSVDCIVMTTLETNNGLLIFADKI